MKGEYYKTKESVQEYIDLAKDVNGLALIEKLKLYLPSNSNLLEIGSGPGTDFGILNKIYNLIGSDYSKEFLNYLKQIYPSETFLELGADTLETELTFDGIYSNKVLHHLNDVELTKSIRRQYEVLNPNGIICHSFWKGEGSEVFKGLFVNYHTNEHLKNEFGTRFEILFLDSYEEFEDGDSILLIGRKRKI